VFGLGRLRSHKPDNTGTAIRAASCIDKCIGG
jgi:hypothetical protein